MWQRFAVGMRPQPALLAADFADPQPDYSSKVGARDIRPSLRAYTDPMKDKQLEKLMRQAQGKAASKGKGGPRPTYDPTLEATKRPEEASDNDAAFLFKEMKKREF